MRSYNPPLNSWKFSSKTHIPAQQDRRSKYGFSQDKKQMNRYPGVISPCQSINHKAVSIQKSSVISPPQVRSPRCPRQYQEIDAKVESLNYRVNNAPDKGVDGTIQFSNRETVNNRRITQASKKQSMRFQQSPPQKRNQIPKETIQKNIPNTQTQFAKPMRIQQSPPQKKKQIPQEIHEYNSTSFHQVSPHSFGLRNIGNTCYMNSSLQCLIHTPEVLPAPSQGRGGQFVKEFLELVKGVSKGAVEPYTLWKIIGRRNSTFANRQQHDAQEVILAMLSAIHQEMNQSQSEPVYRMLEKLGSDQDLSAIYEQFHKQYTSSFLNKVLIGQFKSVEICNCGAKRPKQRLEKKNFDEYFIINLPLPKYGCSMSLESCLNQFKANLSVDYKCDECGSVPEKRICIYKTKDILIFALPRFTMQFEKMLEFIDFPLRLDMRNHVESYKKKEPLQYELYGVVYHIGSTLSSGHYVANCLSESGWWKYNDSYVSQLFGVEKQLRNQIVNTNASILFYRRKR